MEESSDRITDKPAAPDERVIRNEIGTKAFGRLVALERWIEAT